MDRYQDLLRGYIRSMLNDGEQSSDVLQQVLLQLYLSLPTLYTHMRLKGWLFRVARNRWIDEVRQKRHDNHDDVAWFAKTFHHRSATRTKRLLTRVTAIALGVMAMYPNVARSHLASCATRRIRATLLRRVHRLCLLFHSLQHAYERFFFQVLLFFSPISGVLPFPLLCGKISELYHLQRNNRREKKIDDICAEIRSSMLTLHQQNIYPSIRKVTLAMGNPYILFSNVTYETWREMLRGLGYSTKDEIRDNV